MSTYKVGDTFSGAYKVCDTFAAATCLLLLFSVTACRDEQAGPKSRPGNATANSAAAVSAPAAMKVLDAAPEKLTHPSQATWANGALHYLGSNVEPQSPKPGQPVRVTHFFKATGPLPEGWKFFTHLVDATTGQMLGNADHDIQNGAAPLEKWPAGKIIPDEVGLQMPNYPNPIQFLMGFWRGEERLAVDDPAQHDGQFRVRGPKLEGPTEKLPEYRASRAAKPPTIDGKLDDAVWKSAQAAQLVMSFDGKPTTVKTVARLAWDDTNLYVAFDCEDKDAWGSLRNKDDAIYNEDVAEIFIDADGDGETYNELQVSPHNVNFDASFTARRVDLPGAMKWESGMKTAVQVRGTLDDDSDKDDGWSAEMQIPIANLTSVPRVPPQAGDKWRFNLYRLEHHVRRKDIEGQAFSPLFMGDFHHLPRFGWLIFQ